MSILICVIIALVAINVVLAYYIINMHFFMKNRVNSIIRNSETLINISQDLKNCAGKVNSEPKNINIPISNNDKFLTTSILSKIFTLMLSYVRDINTCVVYFTFMLSAGLFFLAKLIDKKSISQNNFTLYIFFLAGLTPTVFVLAKLCIRVIDRVMQKKWWSMFASIIIFFVVGFILMIFLHFSGVKLVPDVMETLKKMGLLNKDIV